MSIRKIISTLSAAICVLSAGIMANAQEVTTTGEQEQSYTQMEIQPRFSKSYWVDLGSHSQVKVARDTTMRDESVFINVFEIAPPSAARPTCKKIEVLFDPKRGGSATTRTIYESQFGQRILLGKTQPFWDGWEISIRAADGGYGSAHVWIYDETSTLGQS